MRYVLAVLSHGNPYSDTAEACLDSFLDQVTPMPAFVAYRHDGPGHAFIGVGQKEGAGFAAHAGSPQVGFCAATGLLWASALKVAVDVQADYVFWLEHDFKFTRPVDLEQLAYVLKTNKGLAQMALMRGPVNAKEKQAGGLVESRPGEFRSRITSRGIKSPREILDWLEHRSYFTTNPSLMRVGFMQQHAWPSYTSECEGRFGLDLVSHGLSFAAWGEGEPWVTHIGERSGFGY